MRDEALGPCWFPGLWVAVIFREQPLPDVVVVLMGLLVAVTYTGGKSMLLVRPVWPRGPEDEGQRP